MSITIEWFDDDHTILLATLKGQWTWEEVWEADEQGAKMAMEMGHRVGAIYDLTDSNPFPPPGALFHLRRSVDLNRNPRGLTVIVKASRMVKAITKVMWLFFPSSAEKFPFEFADTVAEADAILMRHREEWA
jgi:hypothetical protein